VAEGGLAVALAEAAVAGQAGVRVGDVDGHAGLFGESPSRVLLCVAPGAVAALAERARVGGVPMRSLGPVGGDRVVVEGLLDVAVSALSAAWQDCLPSAFRVAATH
jgi:phosphoribosylformylglycinamidine synthase